MNSVVSATTHAPYGAGAGTSKSSRFFRAADDLFAHALTAYERGAYDVALEYGYRAALRLAGAVNADSAAIKKRKRLPSSAWDRLQLTGARGQFWARELSAYSALRGRVASGIEVAPDPTVVRGLLTRVERFREESVPGVTLVA
ncbi:MULTISPECIES: SAV_6107 family HEPN domain-containing protein [unclassified Corynebacterium]|uniref:SAV_6107 family HEPN domain-containing protein n=1 Tax=unclassified Corynebacterium TaxID=2624378 RepID=UPI002A918F2D|nr:SAV_6107 family HEPN domain-containing protein [Corynebacterium sp.]MDY5786098.1 SAV_6107 family HEPN domain-containing protein [Corynebacterium sp.]